MEALPLIVSVPVREIVIGALAEHAPDSSRMVSKCPAGKVDPAGKVTTLGAVSAVKATILSVARAA